MQARPAANNVFSNSQFMPWTDRDVARPLPRAASGLVEQRAHLAQLVIAEPPRHQPLHQTAAAAPVTEFSGQVTESLLHQVLPGPLPAHRTRNLPRLVLATHAFRFEPLKQRLHRGIHPSVLGELVPYLADRRAALSPENLEHLEFGPD